MLNLSFTELETITDINNCLLFNYYQTDIDDLKRQNGILDQQGMVYVNGKISGWHTPLCFWGRYTWATPAKWV